MGLPKFDANDGVLTSSPDAASTSTDRTHNGGNGGNGRHNGWMAEKGEFIPSDNPFVFWLSLGLAIFFNVVVIATVVVTFVRRHHQPLKLRSFTIYLMMAVSCLVMVDLLLVRQLVTREKFPCFIYSGLYFVIIPAYVLPFLLHSLRIYFIYKINVFKDLEIFKETEEGLTFRASQKEVSLPLTTKVQKLRKYVTDKFILKVYGAIMLIHVVAYALMVAFIPSLRTVRGCSIGRVAFIGIGVELGIYLIAVLVCVYLMKNVKENFKITREMFMCFAIWLLVVIVFITCTVLPSYRIQVEYKYFPSGFFLIVGATITFAINFVYPLGLSFSKQNNSISEETKQVQQSELQQVLESAEARGLFKGHCAREFATENIAFWEEVSAISRQDFRRDNNFQKQAQNLYDSYVDENGIGSLNLTKETREAMREALMKGDDMELYNHLLRIQQDVEILLLEKFTEWRNSSEYLEWREKEEIQQHLLEEVKLI